MGGSGGERLQIWWGERDCGFSGMEWVRKIADLVGDGVGERLLIYWGNEVERLQI